MNGVAGADGAGGGVGRFGAADGGAADGGGTDGGGVAAAGGVSTAFSVLPDSLSSLRKRRRSRTVKPGSVSSGMGLLVSLLNPAREPGGMFGELRRL